MKNHLLNQIIAYLKSLQQANKYNFLNNLNPYNEDNIKRCQQTINEYAVYEENGKVIGMVKYGENKKDYNRTYGEIYALYVDSNYQHQNIGTKLVDYVLNEFKGKYKYALISTLKDNTANKFYQKIGGELIGESEFILENNKYKENVYRYKI